MDDLYGSLLEIQCVLLTWELLREVKSHCRIIVKVVLLRSGFTVPENAEQKKIIHSIFVLFLNSVLRHSIA